MAGPGAVLVAAWPAGPAHPVRGVVRWAEDRAGEQVGNLVTSQRDLVCRAGAAGVLEGGGDGEGCGGKHGEGGPPVPGGPAAGLMLIQASQAFAGLEVLLDGPAEPGHLHQGGQRDRAGAVAAVEGQFPGAPVPADQQVPVPRAGIADGDPCPVVPSVSFGADPCGQRLPGPRGSRAAS